ncbi:hypothetical protein GCM10025868_02540 [Angustibacter aerolatus]|uniref:Uncharacterized protein n=1 Tax=Angustibacter aerolatus TaxID=1162965 RepID=A0ABQ6JB30_9ACTN|nr:hypothetical protein GCM10025868_02540 [Angustibacter aerolatus]
MLADDGAHTQRPLWASTGVKDPAYPDTMYVTELVAPNTVNTMPGKTIDAVGDHGEVHGDTIHGTYDEARAQATPSSASASPTPRSRTRLEREAVEKFEKSLGRACSRPCRASLQKAAK